MNILQSNHFVQTTDENVLRSSLITQLTRYIHVLDLKKDRQGTCKESIEALLYEAVMQYTRGNQSEPARLLGVSRGTLRNKLKKFFNTTHVGILV